MDVPLDFITEELQRIDIIISRGPKTPELRGDCEYNRGYRDALDDLLERFRLV
jgi:hypothetical protein